MTRADARFLLDAASRGWPIPEWAITQALIETGDVEAEGEFTRLVRSTWEPIEVPQQVWYVYAKEAA